MDLELTELGHAGGLLTGRVTSGSLVTVSELGQALHLGIASSCGEGHIVEHF